MPFNRSRLKGRNKPAGFRLVHHNADCDTSARIVYLIVAHVADGCKESCSPA